MYQKFKPDFNIDQLIKDNKALVDDFIIVEISKLPLLLNSQQIDFSDLCIFIYIINIENE